MIDYRIHRTAKLARGVVPGAFTVIDAGASIGERVTIGPMVYVAAGVTIGAGAQIGPHALVYADVPNGTTVAPGETWIGNTIEAAVADFIGAPPAVRIAQVKKRK